MARTNNLTNFLTDVADAIREKKGTQETIQASDFDTEIENLPSGGSDNTYSFYNDGTMPYTDVNNGINVIINSNVPIYGFGSGNNESCTNIREVTMTEEVEEINNYAFYRCSRMTLKNNKLPSKLKLIGNYAFYGCNSLKISTIPDGVSSLNNGAFSGCTSITQLSMNVVYFSSTSNSTAVFYSTYLKAVWIGEKITSIGRYGFPSSKIEKIYIDLPRSKVERFSGYSYKFCNNANSNVEIICNDDEGFITREQFDALVVE
jgi:hypothetical protein